MADVNPSEATTDLCCTPERQATCCQPAAKAECCGHGDRCDCDAGSDTAPAGDVREQVRERYLDQGIRLPLSVDAALSALDRIEAGEVAAPTVS